MIAVVIAVAFLLGWLASTRWSTRMIDHRWYCGARHPAVLPCRPTESYLRHEANWRRADEHGLGPDCSPECRDVPLYRGHIPTCPRYIAPPPPATSESGKGPGPRLSEEGNGDGDQGR
jgi:hypothetical protein